MSSRYPLNILVLLKKRFALRFKPHAFHTILLTLGVAIVIAGSLAAALILTGASLVGNSLHAIKQSGAVCYKTGILEADEFWTPDCLVYVVDNVVVPSGRKLTIEPGVVIKNALYSTVAIDVNDGGTLNATGTTELPITFTNIEDDSIKGDTGGNGPVDESRLIYSGGTFVRLRGAATVNLSHATLRYSQRAIDADCQSNSSLVVDGNLIQSPVYIVGCRNDSAIVTRNTFDIRKLSGYNFPLHLSNMDIGSVHFDGEGKNTFLGDGTQLAVYFIGTNVPNDKSWVFDPTTGAVPIISNFTVTGSSSFKPGSTVKVISDNATNGIVVRPTGTLAISGTDDNRVTITSSSDDSLKGNSTNHQPIPNVLLTQSYNTAIDNSYGGKVAIDHAIIRYGSRAIKQNGCNDLTHLNVTDNELNSPVEITDCKDNKVIFQRNNFSLLSENVTAALNVQEINTTGIALSGAEKNTFTGVLRQVLVMFANVTVPSGESWSYDPTTGAQLLVSEFHVDGTATLMPGVTIYVWAQQGFDIRQGGSLIAHGTSTQPIVFTNPQDELGSQPGLTMYQAAIGVSGGMADLSHIVFRNGSTGVKGRGGNSNVSIDNSRFDTLYYSVDETTLENGYLAVTNSIVNARMNLSGNYRLNIARNIFEIPNPDQYALTVNSSEISGIISSGDNANELHGSVMNRSLKLNSVYVGLDRRAIFGEAGNLNAYVLSGLSVRPGGWLTIEPGVVLKTSDKGITVEKSFTTATDGRLTVSGSMTQPIIFTSSDDDSVAGDTNGDQNRTLPIPGSGGTQIRYESPHALLDTLEYAVFRYANSAISTSADSDTILYINHVQFAYTVKAIASDTVSTSFPIAEFVPCIYPYGNLILINDVWFGADGRPGTSFSLDLLGQLTNIDLPEGAPKLLGDVYAATKPRLLLSANVMGNTIPWDDFRCGFKNPPVEISIKVSPVFDIGTLSLDTDTVKSLYGLVAASMPAEIDAVLRIVGTPIWSSYAPWPNLAQTDSQVSINTSGSP